MTPPLLLSCTAYNGSQKIPSYHCYSENQAFCCLLTCHHLPILVHSYAICSIHLCRPDLFSYKDDGQCKAEQRALVGKERMTPLYFVVVVVCSPDPGGVLASVVLVFKFASADSKATSWGHVNRVLRRRLKTNSTFLNVDQSTLRLTGKCLRFVFLVLNLFLILCCS